MRTFSKIFLSGVFLFMFLTVRGKSFSDSGYIQIEWNGAISKPIPTIRFHLPDSKYIFEKEDTIGHFTPSLIQIEVGEKLLDSIQRCIENSNLSKTEQPSQTLSILFYYTRNREIKMFESKNKYSIRDVFDKIITLFNRSDKSVTIKWALDTILSRFSAEITH